MLLISNFAAAASRPAVFSSRGAKMQLSPVLTSICALHLCSILIYSSTVHARATGEEGTTVVTLQLYPLFYTSILERIYRVRKAILLPLKPAVLRAEWSVQSLPLLLSAVAVSCS